MAWLGLELPMQTREQLRLKDYDAMVGTYIDQEEDDFMGDMYFCSNLAAYGGISELISSILLVKW